MSADNEKRPLPEKTTSQNLISAKEWLRQAVTQSHPPGMIACWQCGQWRTDKEQPCEHCHAVYIPF